MPQQQQWTAAAALRGPPLKIAQETDKKKTRKKCGRQVENVVVEN